MLKYLLKVRKSYKDIYIINDSPEVQDIISEFPYVKIFFFRKCYEDFTSIDHLHFQFINIIKMIILSRYCILS